MNPGQEVRLKRGPQCSWTKEEEASLKQAVERFGAHNWDALLAACPFPGRTMRAVTTKWHQINCKEDDRCSSEEDSLTEEEDSLTEEDDSLILRKVTMSRLIWTKEEEASLTEAVGIA